MKRFLNYAVAIGIFTIPFLYLSCNEGTFPDPCERIRCENGANCVEGVCVCAEGWKGERCNVEISPISAEIRNILIERLPTGNLNGNPWDRDTTGPDVYFLISEAVNSQLVERFRSEVLMDTTTGNLYFDLEGLNVTLGNPASPHAVIINDQDDNTFQNMGSAGFIPYQPGLGFKDTIQAESPDKKTAVRIVLRYRWQ